VVDIEREVRERGSVVWQDSARGGAGYYRWRVRLPDGETRSGIAETSEHGWAVIREYVAAPHRQFRYRQRNPGPCVPPE
jgi:hypothetical protein